jgi:ketosteroid isomerase-like protein
MDSADRKDVVRTALESWSGGDWDAALALCAPDIEIDNSTVQGEWRGEHRGADQVVAMWRKFVEAWESVDVRADEFFDAGDHLITSFTGRYAGRDGINLTAHNWACWTVRGGLIERLVMSNELGPVLAAAGVRELPRPEPA